MEGITLGLVDGFAVGENEGCTERILLGNEDNAAVGDTLG